MRLRRLEARDVPALFHVFSNAEAMAYWSARPMIELDEAEELLAEICRLATERTLAQWGVALRERDEVICTCTLPAIDLPNRRAELGFALAREHWGQGYMLEAVARLLDFALGPLGLVRLEADVDPRNERSLRLLDKLGFVREGYARERWRVRGGVQDSVLLALLARERVPFGCHAVSFESEERSSDTSVGDRGP